MNTIYVLRVYLRLKVLMAGKFIYFVALGVPFQVITDNAAIVLN